MPIAFSYVRFSHPDQIKGDSLRRQTEAAQDWCKQNNVVLDTSTTLHDLGRSAFTGTHRHNPDRHALAGFLRLVEQGKVARGSYLIIENLDRLSREHILPALTLLLNLIQAGVRVVQLKPVEQVFDEKVEPMSLMMAIMELTRGHGESAMKSERLTGAWQTRKKRARETGRVVTRLLPAWLREKDGKPILIPDRAEVVRRIFDMAAAGYGQTSIVKKLTQEGVPAFGPSGVWGRSYINLILKDRRAIGEYQPRKRDRSTDGEPIPGFYPAVVSEDTWYAARAGAVKRKWKPGRIGKHVNVFSGLLYSAVDGDVFYVATRTDQGKQQRVLLNRAATEGRTKCQSFPFPTFEVAALSQLIEVNPHDVLNGDSRPDEVLALSNQHEEKKARLAEVDAQLRQLGDVATLGRLAAELETEIAALAARISEARQTASHPLSEAWGEAKGILAALDSAPDPLDARLRLRAALRRIINRITLLVVPAGRDRLAAVSVQFAGEHKGRFREYLIAHRPPKGNGKSQRSGGWAVRSVAIQLPDNLPKLGRDLPEENPQDSLEQVQELLVDWYQEIREEPAAWRPLP
jgi:DNA invertase Pin-like site-specific DNA recombinase